MCCSTDRSVSPGLSVSNVSSTRGAEVSVYLGGLTNNQTYYCKAAATIMTSATCGSPVVGGVKILMKLDSTEGNMFVSIAQPYMMTLFTKSRERRQNRSTKRLVVNFRRSC